jgi:uncharacterized protein YjbI with pentapeptide repeats
MAQLSEVTAQQSKFTGADLTYADLSHAVIQEADFSYAQLYMADLHEAYDEKTTWSGSTKKFAKKTNKKRLKAEQWGKK